MTATDRLMLRTSNLEVAIDAVSRVYCPHRIAPIGPVRQVDASLEVRRPGVQPIVSLGYSTPVSIDAGHFPNLALMMTASAGSAEVCQRGQRTCWRRGQTMPLSPGLETRLRFDGLFSQTSLRLDTEHLGEICRRWLGHPIDRPVCFALRPFDTELELNWQQALQLATSAARLNSSRPAEASRALDEFLLSLLLNGHPHNYSEEFASPQLPACRRVVHDAETIMHEQAPNGITVSEVAKILDISIRSLQIGFRTWRQTTPTAILRKAKLDAANKLLATPTAETRVTDVALSVGFAHAGRFSAAYKSHFGESPVSTLRRGQRSMR